MTTTTDTPTGPSRVRIWDPLLRLLHWSLVATMAASWFTRHSPGRWHEWVGYAALAVVLVRMAWGFVGPEYARFGQFVRGRIGTRDYVMAALAGRAPRYLGHNPLGGWMTIALLLTVTAIGVTGWMYTTDRFWGIAWVGNTHLWLTYFSFLLIGLHVVGVAWTSWKCRENLVVAMVHGCKAPPRDGDVA